MISVQNPSSEKADRNASIVAARQAGSKYGEISREFDISIERARQIVNRAMWRSKWTKQ